MGDPETFTELSVQERRDLREKILSTGEYRDVRLTWDSNRSSQPVSIEGKTAPLDRLTGGSGRNVEMVVETDERKGLVYVEVMENHMENAWHAPIVAYTTGSPASGRNPRLGELLDVEVIE